MLKINRVGLKMLNPKCGKFVTFFSPFINSLCVCWQSLGSTAVWSRVSTAGSVGGLGCSFCRQHHFGPGGLRVCGYASVHQRCM